MCWSAWTGLQSVAGLTHKPRQHFTLTVTPTCCPVMVKTFKLKTYLKLEKDPCFIPLYIAVYPTFKLNIVNNGLLTPAHAETDWISIEHPYISSPNQLLWNSQGVFFSCYISFKWLFLHFFSYKCKIWLSNSFAL